MAHQSSILAWKIPGMGEPDGLPFGVTYSRTRLKQLSSSSSSKIPWRRERLPTPVFWPREFHGVYSPWGRKESYKMSDFHFSSAFYIFQLSHPHMTTGKTIALTRWTFVGKVISLLLNMLSKLVITFLPRSKCLLISWLQSSFAVILEPQKIKSDTVSTVSPSISHEVMGPDTVIFVF